MLNDSAVKGQEQVEKITPKRGVGKTLEVSTAQLFTDRPILISVVVCTYNRSHSLRMTLTSVAAQTPPRALDWEILVIDNNSSDETRQVVEEFCLQYPERFRYVFESQQGISHARNAGVRNSRGEIVAFIDDDETADAQWLLNLTMNLSSDEWAGAGGRVKPQWNESPPRWMLSDSSFIAGPLAMFGPAPGDIELVDPPFGANMAFKRSVFEKFGGFRTDLGRVGRQLLSGEDTEFGRRILNAGLRLRYEANAITYHPVEKSRCNRKYFLRWWFNKGKSDVREQEDHGRNRNLFSILLRLFRNAAVEAVRWAITQDGTGKFICVLKIWTYSGQASEYCREALAARGKAIPQIKAPGHNQD